jgi:basic membrane protein A
MLAIGVDTDQYYTVPECQEVMLTSAMKLITPGVFDLLKMAQEGNFPAGGNFMGEAGLAPYHDCSGQVPTEADARVQEIADAFLSGSLDTGVAPVKPE